MWDGVCVLKFVDMSCRVYRAAVIFLASCTDVNWLVKWQCCQIQMRFQQLAQQLCSKDLGSLSWPLTRVHVGQPVSLSLPARRHLGKGRIKQLYSTLGYLSLLGMRRVRGRLNTVTKGAWWFVYFVIVSLLHYCVCKYCIFYVICRISGQRCYWLFLIN